MDVPRKNKDRIRQRSKNQQKNETQKEYKKENTTRNKTFLLDAFSLLISRCDSQKTEVRRSAKQKDPLVSLLAF
jgi:hypothetical protein